MILAAGRGERMRPLTDHTPKPLLKAGGKPLIVHHIERLRSAGYRELVINTHYLGTHISSALGNGEQWQVNICYSEESPKALETAGGIRKALTLLGEEPFLVINGDIWCDHPLTAPTLRPEQSAHLVLVPNPPHNPTGDFGLRDGLVTREREYTFSGIGWYRPELFRELPEAPAPLAPLLRQAISGSLVSGEIYRGQWMDIGTPERLSELEKQLSP